LHNQKVAGARPTPPLQTFPRKAQQDTTHRRK